MQRNVMKVLAAVTIGVMVTGLLAARPPIPRTRWEFYFLADQRGKWDEKTKPIIDSLGREGWELVNYIPAGSTDFGGYGGESIFKRPLDGP